mmetsp:Transcript_444/g.970  ORF Transcript_444/g.970 Transcript_444/m.970 type:complete len:88 (-) Transcript_444:174-437(-)
MHASSLVTGSGSVYAPPLLQSTFVVAAPPLNTGADATASWLYWLLIAALPVLLCYSVLRTRRRLRGGTGEQARLLVSLQANVGLSSV